MAPLSAKKRRNTSTSTPSPLVPPTWHRLSQYRTSRRDSLSQYRTSHRRCVSTKHRIGYVSTGHRVGICYFSTAHCVTSA
eukprot:361602-Rhodomonas_salina.4